MTYGFLTNPSLLNNPYREVASETGVAVGTVGIVIDALKAGKYIQDGIRTKKRSITDYQKLLDRWVEAWPGKLKHKHFLGTFTTDRPRWWKETKIQDYQGYWGGETAAAQYTNYLNPEITTLYIPKKSQASLIRKARLVKADETTYTTGTRVHMYTPFWVLKTIRKT